MYGGTPRPDRKKLVNEPSDFTWHGRMWAKMALLRIRQVLEADQILDLSTLLLPRQSTCDHSHDSSHQG